jgi:hypothetical protein
MDGKPLARIAAYLLVPLVFLALLPLLFLFVLGFYVLALCQGVHHLLTFWWGKKESNDPVLQKPHFLEAQQSAKPPVNGKSASSA